MTDIPYLIPVQVDDGRYPLVLIQTDSFDPFPGIMVCGGPDTMKVAEEIARRCNNFKE